MNKFMLGAMLFSAACAVNGGGEPTTTDAGRTGLGDEHLNTADGTIADLPGASEERPCGEHTVANVALPNGNRLAFCVLPSGLEMVHEIGQLGTPAWYAPKSKADKPTCGVNLYLQATGANVPVPDALVKACPAGDRAPALAARHVTSASVFQPVVAEVENRRTSYCNVSDATFAAERCYHCNPYDDCIDWCVSDHWGWHDRTMSFSNFLGEEGNDAIETNASCVGLTRVRQWERDDSDDAWGSPDSDYNVQPSHWANSGFIFHSGFLGQDYDFRLRADTAAVSGAYHQHSGYFLDE